MEAVLAQLGATDPTTSAATLMVCAEGLIPLRIVRHDGADPRPAFTLEVSAALHDDSRTLPTRSHRQ